MKKIIKLPLQVMSRIMFLFPSVLFFLQRTVFRVAAQFDIFIAFRLIRRPEWLLMPRAMHKASLTFSNAPVLKPSDVVLAARVIQSYACANEALQSRHPGVEPGTLWDLLIQTHYSQLHNLLLNGNKDSLAEFFSRVFQTETVNGYTNGTTFNAMPHRWWTFAVAIEVNLVCLAEAVGVVRAECPEQGVIGYALQPDGDKVIEKLEQHFGFRVEAPTVGAARGVMLGNRFLTREVCSQIYTAYRIREALNSFGTQTQLNIVEIGGGYGGLCLWLHRLLGERIADYVIVDLPITNAVQSYFLTNTLNKEVRLFGESRNSELSENTVKLVPHFALSDLAGSYNVLINQDSMPELPSKEVDRYLSWASQNVDGLFFSFNQEAFSVVSGTPQVLLPEMVAHYENFERLTRHTSWDRRGYVEEVYRVTP